MRELLVTLPKESFIYVADQKNVPYGKKSLAQVRSFSERITEYLLSRGAKCIVIPCNTASGAALNHLREMFPRVPFIGMEPAVKPAAEFTQSGKVGILATAGTFKSERYCSLLERFGGGIDVFENPCIGLVEHIESGDFESKETLRYLEKIVNPMVKEGIDVLVLGCTHYPFVESSLRKILPPEIQVINPAPAVARQVKKRLGDLDLLLKRGKQEVDYLTTGDEKEFQNQIFQLLNLVRETKHLNLIRRK